MYKSSFRAAARTLWVGRCIAVLILLLCFGLPFLLSWYRSFRSLTGAEQTAILIAYYCCVPLILAALFFMDRLLRSILDSLVFTDSNVRCIRRIQLCCAGVGLVCAAAALAYLPLWFLAVMMGFLCLAVGVVARVMEAAVAIREENDLTV